MFCCLEAFEPIPRYQGLAHETESIPLTEYCRVFLAHRRGDHPSECLSSVSRRGAELKILCIMPSSALGSKVPKTLRRTDEGFL